MCQCRCQRESRVHLLIANEDLTVNFWVRRYILSRGEGEEEHLAADRAAPISTPICWDYLSTMAHPSPSLCGEGKMEIRTGLAETESAALGLTRDGSFNLAYTESSSKS